MEQNKNIPKPFSIDTSDDDESSDLQAFIERLNAVPGMVKTRSHLLEEHFRSGNEAEFDKIIEKIVDDIAEKVPEYTSNLEKIKYLRSFADKDKQAMGVLIARQNELRQYYRSIAISEAGLPDDMAFSKIELAKESVGNILGEAYPEDTYTPNEALETLGIISYNENKEKVYSFPEQLVPESTNDKWKTYLAAVCAHVKACDDLRTTGDKDAVIQADRTRTFAHNEATRELHAILGLEANKNWAFADTRALLGKIRDQVLPTHDAAVSDASKKLIEEQTARLIASADLSSH